MTEFATLASFDYVTEAEMVKLFLEKEGIDVQLEDANLVAMDPLLSVAAGGVKLQVPAEHFKRASVLLEMRNAARKMKEARPDVTFDCDECGKTMTFPGARRGGVEDCPHCHAYVDVPD